MRILTPKEVCRMVPYSPRHLYRLEKSGRFPGRVRLGPGRVGFVEEEVEAWLKIAMADRDLKRPQQA